MRAALLARSQSLRAILLLIVFNSLVEAFETPVNRPLLAPATQRSQRIVARDSPDHTGKPSHLDLCISWISPKCVRPAEDSEPHPLLPMGLKKRRNRHSQADDDNEEGDSGDSDENQAENDGRSDDDPPTSTRTQRPQTKQTQPHTKSHDSPQGNAHPWDDAWQDSTTTTAKPEWQTLTSAVQWSPSVTEPSSPPYRTPAPSNQASRQDSDEAADLCTVLSQVYQDLDGDNWKNKTGWQPATDSWTCCRRHGVTCDEDSNMTALQLASNGLRGQFPSALFSVNTLTTLNLSRNAVSGSLQDSFGSLPRLAYLSIDSNQLSGPLPESLRTLASLKAVHIGNNSLSGSLLFPNAWQLVDLYAGHNQFTYLNISANTRLQRVVLSDNALSVAVPDIRSFVNLTLFAAARNSLQGSVPPLAGGKKLKILDLSRNKLTGVFPDIQDLPVIASLRLQGNRFGGMFPKGSAPWTLNDCQTDPMSSAQCPDSGTMADPTSWASKCHLRCTNSGKQRQPPIASNNATTPSDEYDGYDLGQTPASLAENISHHSGTRLATALQVTYLACAVILAFAGNFY